MRELIIELPALTVAIPAISVALPVFSVLLLWAIFLWIFVPDKPADSKSKTAQSRENSAEGTLEYSEDDYPANATAYQRGQISNDGSLFGSSTYSETVGRRHTVDDEATNPTYDRRFGRPSPLDTTRKPPSRTEPKASEKQNIFARDQIDSTGNSDSDQANRPTQDAADQTVVRAKDRQNPSSSIIQPDELSDGLANHSNPSSTSTGEATNSGTKTSATPGSSSTAKQTSGILQRGSRVESGKTSPLAGIASNQSVSSSNPSGTTSPKATIDGLPSSAAASQQIETNKQNASSQPDGEATNPQAKTSTTQDSPGTASQTSGLLKTISTAESGKASILADGAGTPSFTISNAPETPNPTATVDDLQSSTAATQQVETNKQDTFSQHKGEATNPHAKTSKTQDSPSTINQTAGILQTSARAVSGKTSLLADSSSNLSVTSSKTIETPNPTATTDGLQSSTATNHQIETNKQDASSQVDGQHQREQSLDAEKADHPDNQTKNAAFSASVNKEAPTNTGKSTTLTSSGAHRSNTTTAKQTTTANHLANRHNQAAKNEDTGTQTNTKDNQSNSRSESGQLTAQGHRSNHNNVASNNKAENSHKDASANFTTQPSQQSGSNVTDSAAGASNTTHTNQLLTAAQTNNGSDIPTPTTNEPSDSHATTTDKDGSAGTTNHQLTATSQSGAPASGTDENRLEDEADQGLSANRNNQTESVASDQDKRTSLFKSRTTDAAQNKPNADRPRYQTAAKSRHIASSIEAQLQLRPPVAKSFSATTGSETTDAESTKALAEKDRIIKELQLKLNALQKKQDDGNQLRTHPKTDSENPATSGHSQASGSQTAGSQTNGSLTNNSEASGPHATGAGASGSPQSSGSQPSASQANSIANNNANNPIDRTSVSVAATQPASRGPENAAGKNASTAISRLLGHNKSKTSANHAAADHNADGKSAAAANASEIQSPHNSDSAHPDVAELHQLKRQCQEAADKLSLREIKVQKLQSTVNRLQASGLKETNLHSNPANGRELLLNKVRVLAPRV